jgi:hypothetical protein
MLNKVKNKKILLNKSKKLNLKLRTSYRRKFKSIMMIFYDFFTEKLNFI